MIPPTNTAPAAIHSQAPDTTDLTEVEKLHRLTGQYVSCNVYCLVNRRVVSIAHVNGLLIHQPYARRDMPWVVRDYREEKPPFVVFNPEVTKVEVYLNSDTPGQSFGKSVRLPQPGDQPSYPFIKLIFETSSH